MDETMIEIEVFKKDSDGRLTVSDEAAARLKEIETQLKTLKAEESSLRASILERMSANKIDRCSSNGVTFSQILPKPIGTFDTESFLLNESEDIIKFFTTFDEEKHFNEESFKAENPELYERYTETAIIPTVDTEKMKKNLTTVFDKYWHEEASDKLPTLRVSFKKGE